MSDRDLSCEFRIRIYCLRIRYREVERTVLVSGFHVWSSVVAGGELQRGGGLVHQPELEGRFESEGRGLAREGNVGSPLLNHHGPRPIELVFCTLFSIPAPPFRLGLSFNFVLGTFWIVCVRFISLVFDNYLFWFNLIIVSMLEFQLIFFICFEFQISLNVRTKIDNWSYNFILLIV